MCTRSHIRIVTPVTVAGSNLQRPLWIMPKSFVKAHTPMPILNWLSGRKRRVYVLGVSKSGTTSIARMFSSVCRADHEPHRPATVSDLHSHFVGKMSDEQLGNQYRARDRQFLLDLESNCFLAYRPDLLYSAFPGAKYIVTIRHPIEWLDSIIDNNINFPRIKTVTMTKWHDVLFSTDHEPKSRHDNVLLDRGLYSVNTYLSYWSQTYERCLRSLASAQRLLVGTTQISLRVKEIGDFVGLDLSNLQTEGSHKNKTSQKHNILDQLDANYVDESLERYCEPLISEFDLASLWTTDCRDFAPNS